MTQQARLFSWFGGLVLRAFLALTSSLWHDQYLHSIIRVLYWNLDWWYNHFAWPLRCRCTLRACFSTTWIPLECSAKAPKCWFAEGFPHRSRFRQGTDTRPPKCGSCCRLWRSQWVQQNVWVAPELYRIWCRVFRGQEKFSDMSIIDPSERARSEPSTRLLPAFVRFRPTQ
jgi:hypothetical protein